MSICDIITCDHMNLSSLELLVCRSLQDVFPFEGVFHFRVKRLVEGEEFGAQDYLWKV